MLKLVHETSEKMRAQAALARALKIALNDQGSRNVGFQGDNRDLTVYSSGKGKLWAGFDVIKDTADPRYWNAFGVYQPDRSAQMITVEINIPIDSDSRRVAGFFAEDTDSGDIYLMHSGKVGGGRPGIGKSAFLVWSKAELLDVSEPEGGVRKGIKVGRLATDDLAERIWAFVERVANFKDSVVAGVLDEPDFRRRVEEFYSKEFSGNKKGKRNASFEYYTYHGDIVQAIYEEITARLAPDESIFNSTFVDLSVRRAGAVSELYEVKTSVSRQVLYTAIGQLLTHAATYGNEVTKCLVVPDDEPIALDQERAMAVLGIQVRRFHLVGRGRKRTVQLI
ncbi:MAG: hypothetical protein HQL39_05465 [Alphaproteobacteria bacterium]|nr:hypothetical protein [Alphaproteobacteria bacterium]